MAANSVVRPSQLSKYKISRRGRKLAISDDPRILLAMPKDVPERTWAEILEKEENELVCFEIREEILEQALRIVYESYMEKQNAFFTVHCAAQAWLKLIDWNFYRHDPGEDPSAYPPCYIPKRVESWTPDNLPDPSPKDTWGRQELPVAEECPDELQKKWPSSTSLDEPVVEDIPEQYWFPGKITFDRVPTPKEVQPITIEIPGRSRKPPRPPRSSTPASGEPAWNSYDEESYMSLSVGNDSEIVQKVTDYGPKFVVGRKGSKLGSLRQPPSVDGSLQGAGDSSAQSAKLHKRRSRQDKIKSAAWSRPCIGKSRAILPPLLADSQSGVTVISDCRLRNLRLDTQYELSAEKVDTPPIGESAKRK